MEISKKRLGATAVMQEGELQGIITDGDLRRMLEKQSNFENLQAKDIMCETPKNMEKQALAYDALQLMEQYNISQLVVMDGEEYQGIIHIHEIIKEGLV